MKKNIELKIGGIYVAMYIVLLIAQILLFAFSTTDWTIEQNEIRLNSIINLSFYGVMVFLFIAFFTSFWKGALIQFKQRKFEYLKLIGLGFAAMILISYAMSIIYQWVGVTDTSDNQESLNSLLRGAFFDKFSLIVFAVFLAPIVEELVFRMAIFKFLFNIDNIKPWIVVVSSSLIFGFIHVMGSGDYIQIFYYAGLGVILGLFYYRSKNIIVPIIVHMLLNGFVTITMFLM